MLADIRLLRELFNGDDESLVYAPGQGGLSGLWGGEADDEDDTHVDDTPLGPPRGRANQSNNLPSFDDAEEWTSIPQNAQEATEEEEDDSGRRLFKCLQLDLSSFGLEKAGLAHQFAGILTEERINLLYSSTFR